MLGNGANIVCRLLRQSSQISNKLGLSLKSYSYVSKCFTWLLLWFLVYQAAKTKQAIKEEQMQIKVVERSQQIQVQEQEIARREKELHAMVKQPAEAERYRLETIANANMLVTLLAAFLILPSCLPSL